MRRRAKLLDGRKRIDILLGGLIRVGLDRSLLPLHRRPDDKVQRAEVVLLAERGVWIKRLEMERSIAHVCAGARNPLTEPRVLAGIARNRERLHTLIYARNLSQYVV